MRAIISISNRDHNQILVSFDSSDLYFAITVIGIDEKIISAEIYDSILLRSIQVKTEKYL
jgi:hypothetical protein